MIKSPVEKSERVEEECLLDGYSKAKAEWRKLSSGKGVPGPRSGQGHVSESSSSSSDPPLLKGGWRMCPTLLSSVSLDWLTVTMPALTAELLVESSDLEEVGGARPGFASSEKRRLLNFECWRRFDPWREHAKWGTDYESWEWSGEKASNTERWLRGKEMKATRVDIAFDFDVPERVTPENFMEGCERACKSRGLVLGVAGADGVNTRYIGSSRSDRRIRIYRKDLQQLVWKTVTGPTLRVELILKGDPAARFWEVWDEDRDLAKRLASRHVRDMCGEQLLDDDLVEIPQRERVAGMDEAEGLFTFVRQMGPKIAGYTKAGIDLVGLCEMRLLDLNRRSRSRHAKQVEGMKREGGPAIEKLVRRVLSGRRSSDVEGQKA